MGTVLFGSQPLLSVEAGELIDRGSGKVAIRWPARSATVLSVQPDGTYQTRPETAIGPWETAVRQGNRLIFHVGSEWFVLPILGEDL